MRIDKHSAKTRQQWLDDTRQRVDRFVAQHPEAHATEVSLLAQAAADLAWQRLGAAVDWATLNRAALGEEVEARYGDPIFAARVAHTVEQLARAPRQTVLRRLAPPPRPAMAVQPAQHLH